MATNPDSELQKTSSLAHPRLTNAKFIGYLALLLAVVMFLKSTLPLTPLHVALAFLFIGTSFGEFKNIGRGPTPRFGLTVSLVYLLITLGLFFVVAESPIDTVLQKLRFQEVLLIGVLVPFYEEIFFRGVLQNKLHHMLYASSSWKAAAWMIYFNALIFWLFHMPAYGQAWTWALSKGGLPLGPGPFLLGAMCSFIAYKDKGILGAMVFHGFANVAGTLWGHIIDNPDLLKMFYSVQ